MNVFLLLALLFAEPETPPVVKVTPIASYKLEDFHYYDESLKIHGLPLTNKFYISLETDEEKTAFVKYTEKLEKLNNITKADKSMKGLVAVFADKESAFKALNKCLKEGYKVYPIVTQDEVDKIVSHDILVKTHPSVGRGDYSKHLQTCIQGKFEVHVENADPRIFNVEVKEISNPSNVLILANLMNQDRFWVEKAEVVLIPVNGWVSANFEIDTASQTNLGQERTLKLVINVFDPKIDVKLDLLPQIGNTFAPNPYAGEGWLDVKPSQVTQTKTGSKKTITVLYPFRYLQYGKFVFSPTPISYEKNGKVSVTYTNQCPFVTTSVLGNIEDIQSESYSSDLKNMPAVKPEMSKDEYTSIFLADARRTIPGWCGVIAAAFFIGFIVDLLRPLSENVKSTGNEGLWLKLIPLANSPQDLGTYLEIEHALNKLMMSEFKICLYTVDLNTCNDNFKSLCGELNKIHMPSPKLDFELLRNTLTKFVDGRKYD